jgi:hypothetical protein
MSPAVVQQLVLMMAEAAFVGALLVTSFRMRRVFGLALVYIVFGVIFQYAALLAGSMYVQLAPSVRVPSSCFRRCCFWYCSFT